MSRRRAPGALLSDELKALPVEHRMIRAAVELWSTRGYQGVSVQELVDAAGVTKGAFYHYFEGKEDVLKQIHDQFADFEMELVSSAIEEGDSTVERLKLITVALVKAAAVYQRESTIFLRELRVLSTETFAALKRKRDAIEALVLKVVEDGMAAGELRPSTNPKVLVFGIVGMCAWVHQWFDPEGSLTASDVGQLYADLVLTGLLSPEGRQEGAAD